MAAPNVSFFYYDKANTQWKEARTHSGNNAVKLCYITKAINNPSTAEVTLANPSKDSGETDTAKSTGALTDVFSSYTPVFIRDNETGLILFRGRVQKNQEGFSYEEGKDILVVCKDALQELVEVAAGAMPSSLKQLTLTPAGTVEISDTTLGVAVSSNSATSIVIVNPKDFFEGQYIQLTGAQSTEVMKITSLFNADGSMTSTTGGYTVGVERAKKNPITGSATTANSSISQGASVYVYPTKYRGEIIRQIISDTSVNIHLPNTKFDGSTAGSDNGAMVRSENSHYELLQTDTVQTYKEVLDPNNNNIATVDISSLGENALQSINSLAALDGHDSNESNSHVGWDFYVDPNITEMINHGTASSTYDPFKADGTQYPAFNYFKRGTRPALSSFTSATTTSYGLTIEYPSNNFVSIGDAYKSTFIRSASPQSSFEDEDSKLVTSLYATWNETGSHSYTDENFKFVEHGNDKGEGTYELLTCKLGKTGSNVHFVYDDMLAPNYGKTVWLGARGSAKPINPNVVLQKNGSYYGLNIDKDPVLLSSQLLYKYGQDNPCAAIIYATGDGGTAHDDKIVVTHVYDSSTEVIDEGMLPDASGLPKAVTFVAFPTGTSAVRLFNAKAGSYGNTDTPSNVAYVDVIPDTGRPILKHKINKSAYEKFNQSSIGDIRTAIFKKLDEGSVGRVTTAKMSTARYPYTKVIADPDKYNYTIGSATTIVFSANAAGTKAFLKADAGHGAAVSYTNDIREFGLKPGMPIVELDEKGLVARYAYVKSCAVANAGQSTETITITISATSDGVALFNSGTTLSADIDTTSNTNITVADGSKFDVGMYIKIDAEAMLITAISGNTLSVTRAQFGTSADGSGHDSGDAVYRYRRVAFIIPTEPGHEVRVKSKHVNANYDAIVKNVDFEYTGAGVRGYLESVGINIKTTSANSVGVPTIEPTLINAVNKQSFNVNYANPQADAHNIKADDRWTLKTGRIVASNNKTISVVSLFKTQLNEALDASETGVDVDSGAVFKVGQTIQVDSEQMYISAISTNTLTVTRGYNGSTAATHTDNEYISVSTVTLTRTGSPPVTVHISDADINGGIHIEDGSVDADLAFKSHTLYYRAPFDKAGNSVASGSAQIQAFPDVSAADEDVIFDEIKRPTDIIIGKAKAISTTSTFLAEFELYIRTTSMDNGILTYGAQNLPAYAMKQSGQYWSTNLKIEGTAWNTIRFGLKGTIASDATISFGDDSTQVIYASDDSNLVTSGLASGMSYSSPNFTIPANTSVYLYKDVSTDNKDSHAGKSIKFTTTYSDVYQDDRVLLAVETTAADSAAAGGDTSPAIYPFGGADATFTSAVIQAGVFTTGITRDMPGVRMDATGRIQSGHNDAGGSTSYKAYGDNTPGYVLEYNNGAPRFEIGQSNGQFLKFGSTTGNAATTLSTVQIGGSIKIVAQLAKSGTGTGTGDVPANTQQIVFENYTGDGHTFFFANESNRINLWYVPSGSGSPAAIQDFTLLNLNLNPLNGVIKNDTGSAAAPTYTFDGDTDTGMSRTAADTMVLSTGGNAAITMTGAQNVLCHEDLTASDGFTSSTMTVTGLTTSGTPEAYLQIQSDGTFMKHSSSQKHKENIVDLTIDSTKVLNLRPVNFKFKDSEKVTKVEGKPNVTTTVTGKNSFGLIAEEVHEVLPELVFYDGENQPSALDYPLLSVLLLEEIKKLRTEVDALKNG